MTKRIDRTLLERYQEIAARPRPVEIYKQPCPNCPSAHGNPHDPEVKDILTWPREAQKDTLFVCGWRQEKLCKGYCDTLGFTETDLSASQREIK